MRAYNIELFDKRYELVAHGNVDDVVIDIDYVSDTTNSIKMPSDYFYELKNTENRFGDYILIKKGKGFRYVGLTTGIERDSKYTTINFKSILNLFNTNVVIDTNDQGVGTLEMFVSKLIQTNFIQNTDTLQNIEGLNINIHSATFDWGFNFKSDKENMHTVITNLFQNVIARAFLKYNLVLQPDLDFVNERLNISIFINSDDERYFEADLQNVISKKIVIKQNNEAVNKLVVYNTSNYQNTITYYLHSDGTFNENDEDRLVPVVVNSVGVDVENDGDFAKNAKNKAVDVFKLNQNNHLIELEFLKNDELIDFDKMKIGQVSKIVSDGKVYSSVLTGFKIDKTTLLKFGNVRLGLTEILKKERLNDN